MIKRRHVFISHHHADDARVTNLTNMLRRNALEIRNSSIRAKPANAERLRKGLIAEKTLKRLLRMKMSWASTVVVVIGKKTHERPWVNWEIEMAHRLGKRIVGVYEHGGTENDIPPRSGQVRGCDRRLEFKEHHRRYRGTLRSARDTGRRREGQSRRRARMRGLMNSVYMYAVSYDLGFAPNPFGGVCSLACCKPAIRAGAKDGDWIVGLTGTKLRPALRCVFGMQVTRSVTFDRYWADSEFETRKSRRNGSAKKQVGDNIYHRGEPGAPWVQEDSVHSLEDGSQCPLNTAHDTRINRVLLSERFIYFGTAAPAVPSEILADLSYAKNPRDMRKYSLAEARSLIDWLEPKVVTHRNVPLADPINFDASSKRFSATRQRMV